MGAAAPAALSRTRAVVAVVAMLVMAACATEPTPAAPAATISETTAPTVAPVTSSGPVVTTVATEPTSPTAATPVVDAVVPEGFERVAATVTAGDGTVCELCLWLAATGAQRSQGLMFVTDLGDADGMAFRYESPHSGSFWMKNTLLPLSIAFYGPDGAYLDAFDMDPCTADPCPRYPTPDGFVIAIETYQGALADLAMAPGSTLTVSDLPCL